MMISVIYTNNLEYRDYTLCLDSVRHFIIFQSFTLIIHVAKCLVEFNTGFFSGQKYNLVFFYIDLGRTVELCSKVGLFCDCYYGSSMDDHTK